MFRKVLWPPTNQKSMLHASVEPLIVAKTDPAAWAVGVSAAILLAGFFISFYVKPLERKREEKNAGKSDS